MDPFVGGGTALVEGMLLGRRAVGIDINPIACLISRVKTTPISPSVLEGEFNKIMTKVHDRSKNTTLVTRASRTVTSDLDISRIRYWFTDSSIRHLSLILSVIDEVEDHRIREFSLCAFSHILKNCSLWSMRSIKPTRDMHKNIPNPINTFQKHMLHMIMKNLQFDALLPLSAKENLDEHVRVVQDDCRNAAEHCRNASLIVTSPPYVTSYEYFSVHQLSVMWLHPSINFTEYKKKFIGIKHKPLLTEQLASETGRKLVQQLYSTPHAAVNAYARAVQTYFAEMQQALLKFREVLRPGGKICIVIGNTSYYGVTVRNAEVMAETCDALGYELQFIIKRRVPLSAKFLPSARDPRTGNFVSSKGNSKIAYPYEYILTFSKRN